MTHHLHHSTLFSATYGEGTYNCGAFEVGCTSTSANSGVLPPNTSALFFEPSVAIPGSLLLAVLIALITTTIAKFMRQRKSKHTNN